MHTLTEIDDYLQYTLNHKKPQTFGCNHTRPFCNVCENLTYNWRESLISELPKDLANSLDIILRLRQAEQVALVKCRANVTGRNLAMVVKIQTELQKYER